MKIRRVTVHYEMLCCQDCDGPGYYVYGYYNLGYDMRKVILSILNKDNTPYHKTDLEDICIEELELNVPCDYIGEVDNQDNNIVKDVTDKYIRYDVDECEYELRD